jgi:hypothetical protein
VPIPPRLACLVKYETYLTRVGGEHHNGLKIYGRVTVGGWREESDEGRTNKTMQIKCFIEQNKGRGYFQASAFIPKR